jgi:hypothetical protein
MFRLNTVAFIKLNMKKIKMFRAVISGLRFQNLKKKRYYVIYIYIYIYIYTYLYERNEYGAADTINY